MIGFRISVPDLGEAIRGVAGAAERYTESTEFADLVREATVTNPGVRGSIANQLNLGGYFKDGKLVPWKKAHAFGHSAYGRFGGSFTGDGYGATNKPMRRSGSGEPGGSLDSGHAETFHSFWIRGTTVKFRQGRGVIQPNTSGPSWERFKMYQQRPGTEMRAQINGATHVVLQKIYRYIPKGGTTRSIGSEIMFYPQTVFTWHSRPFLPNDWMAEAVARIYKKKVDDLFAQAFSRRQGQAASQNRVAAGVSEGGRFDVGFR